MNTSNTSIRAIPIWGILSVVLTPLMFLCGILGGVILDTFVEKPACLHDYLTPWSSVRRRADYEGQLRGRRARGRHCTCEARAASQLPILGLAPIAFLFGLFIFFE